jgi:type II secretory pathway pseudopilin PulG
MIAPSSLKHSRPGISLLEVLAALAIFLVSFAALGHLVQSSADRALDVQLQSHAARLAQSKLHEVVWGIEPLSSSNGTFGEDADWQWTLDCEQGNLANLWNVTVTVRRDLIDGTHIEFALNQMVLDPSMRGSTFDTPAADMTPDTNASGGSSGAGGAGGAAAGGGAASGATPSGGGATSRPATSGGAGSMPSGGGGPGRQGSGGMGGPTPVSPTPPRSSPPSPPKTGP